MSKKENAGHTAQGSEQSEAASGSELFKVFCDMLGGTGMGSAKQLKWPRSSKTGL